MLQEENTDLSPIFCPFVIQRLTCILFICDTHFEILKHFNFLFVCIPQGNRDRTRELILTLIMINCKWTEYFCGIFRNCMTNN